MNSDAERDRPETIVATKTIAVAGSSLVVHITKEAQLLGLDRGDAVRITLERVR